MPFARLILVLHVVRVHVARSELMPLRDKATDHACFPQLDDHRLAPAVAVDGFFGEFVAAVKHGGCVGAVRVFSTSLIRVRDFKARFALS